jgi:hypothetical protein
MNDTALAEQKGAAAPVATRHVSLSLSMAPQPVATSKVGGALFRGAGNSRKSEGFGAIHSMPIVWEYSGPAETASN